MALAASFEAVPGMAEASRAAASVVSVFRGRVDESAGHLAEVPRDVALDHVPVGVAWVDYTRDPPRSHCSPTRTG